MFGAADRAKADLRTGRCGQHNVQGAHLAHLLKQLARGAAEAARLHPLLERAPEHERQKANQNVRLCAVFLVMENRAQAEVVFRNAERGLGLRQAM